MGSWFHMFGPERLCTMVDLCQPCSLGQLQLISTLLLSSREGCSLLVPCVRPCSAQPGSRCLALAKGNSDSLLCLMLLVLPRS